jgi:hypothetical protein
MKRARVRHGHVSGRRRAPNWGLGRNGTERHLRRDRRFGCRQPVNPHPVHAEGLAHFGPRIGLLEASGGQARVTRYLAYSLSGRPEPHAVGPSNDSAGPGALANQVSFELGDLGKQSLTDSLGRMSPWTTRACPGWFRAWSIPARFGAWPQGKLGWGLRAWLTQYSVDLLP